MEALYKGMEKSIVVVGGAGGIGRCIVEQLRQEYKIYVLDIKDITTSIEQCDTIIPIVGDILEEYRNMKNIKLVTLAKWVDL